MYGYENKEFAEDAAEYYDVESAIKFFNSSVPENIFRWRCKLCGWGMDVDAEQQEIIPACCCGGCGMTCLRPIGEWNG